MFNAYFFEKKLNEYENLKNLRLEFLKMKQRKKCKTKKNII
jgi:hypothetical protein